MFPVHVLKFRGQCELYIHLFQLPDGTGKEPKFVIWGHPGNDVTGMFARCQKVVEPCEEVIAMIIKIARIETYDIILNVSFYENML